MFVVTKNSSSSSGHGSSESCEGGTELGGDRGLGLYGVGLGTRDPGLFGVGE